ncbi:prepilin-type N-terminal cleavage/methylation domain-containing protein, partial [Candidatus Peregrinibacteria bacterium]|nr:prepilin-type N-terminal cleavage/methylation domain-containing protein [Candidatus Peregrinibacteria bacterium]
MEIQKSKHRINNKSFLGKFGILGMTPPQQVKRTRKDSQSAAKPRAAFTLIELLISTSIFAVVAV